MTATPHRPRLGDAGDGGLPREVAAVKITIAICTYNRCKYLNETLFCLLGLDVPPGIELEIIVVDNNSTDDTRTVINSHARSLPILLLHEARQGLSFARNSAIAAASGEWIIWTDDDVLVDRDWLSQYVAAARRWPNAALLGGPINPHFDGRPPWWLSKHLGCLLGPYSLIDPGEPARPMQPGQFPFGANMAFRSEILKQYPFDGKLGRIGSELISGEDSTLALRLFADGYRGAWVSGARVRHCIGKEKQSLSYIWKWYLGNGRTAARLRGLDKGLHEGVASLARSRALELERSRESGLDENWWASFFSGPLWLRTIKAVAYCRGFQQELLRVIPPSLGEGGPTPAVD